MGNAKTVFGVYVTATVHVPTFLSRTPPKTCRRWTAAQCKTLPLRRKPVVPCALPEHRANLPQPVPHLRANTRVLSANSSLNFGSVRSAHLVLPLKITRCRISAARLGSLPPQFWVFLFLLCRRPLQLDFVPFHCCLHRSSLLSAPLPVNLVYITFPVLRADSSSFCRSLCKCAHADL